MKIHERLQVLEAGEVVETTVERLVPGGLGLAHAGGQTLLVPMAAPGDLLRVRVDRTKGRVAFSSVVEVMSGSPDRVAPPCPVYGRCGGCDFQHLSYEAQLAAKIEMIRDSLRRIGDIDPPPEVSMTPSPNPWVYRTRAEWRRDPETDSLGYFERESHRVCDVPTCPILVPELDEALGALRRKVTIESRPDDVRDYHAVAGDNDIVVSPTGAKTSPVVSRSIAGETYWFDVNCFFQVNLGVLEPLIQEVLRFAPSGPTERSLVAAAQPIILAADLYCGVGLFTLPMARRFDRVVGVEAGPKTAGYAESNAARAGLRNVTIERTPVASWLSRQAKSRLPVSYAVIDPPRAGIDDAAMMGLLRLRPTRIAYVSCDPATLARDLKRLLVGHYVLESVVAFDMFPQTHHVEVVAHLRRLSRRSKKVRRAGIE